MVLSSFGSVIPKMDGCMLFVMSLSLSVLDTKPFTFKGQKWKLRVLRGSHILSSLNCIWQGPGFKLIPPKSSNKI